MNHLPRLQSLLGDRLDALLLYNEANCRYASGGFAWTDGFAVITPAESVCFADFRYIEAARQQVQGCEAQLLDGHTAEKVGKLLARCGVQCVGFEDLTLSVAQYETLRQRYPHITFVPLKNELLLLRSVKDGEEIALIHRAQAIAEQAFDALLEKLRPGMSEQQIAARLEYEMAVRGSEAPAFQTIAVSGPNTSLPHGVPGERRLQKGDLLTLDFGATCGGYRSDMTRTLSLGDPGEEARRVYATVLEAQLTACRGLRAGITGCQADALARDVISQAGYGHAFGHSLGHGVGLDIHEAPGLSPKNSEPLPEGAVVTVEPGIYLPGKFGVRIEDMAVLRANGIENLTKAPKELIIL